MLKDTRCTYKPQTLSVTAFISCNMKTNAVLHSAYLHKSNNQRHNFFMKIKECKFAKGLITKKYLKLIEVQCNVLFLSAFGVEVDVINERKMHLEYGRIHI